MIESEPPLSAEAIARREQILNLARRAAAEKRRRRKTTRVAGGIALLILIAAIWRVAFVANQPKKSPDREARIPSSQPAPVQPSPAKSPEKPSPTITITWIQTDPTITDRLAIRPQPREWTPINDDQLLQSMAEAGQPAGIIEMNGQTYLLPR